MTSFEATIPSNWTADETFSYLATFSNARDWDPGVLDAERLDAGQVRAGSRFRLTVPFGSRKLPLTYEVVSISYENRQVRLTAQTALLQVSDQIEVKPATLAENGAVVAYRAESGLRGPLRPFGFVLNRGFRQLCERAVNGLTAALAGQAP